MKERPILFSAPMVRALLAGTKTQTRRIAPIERLDIKEHDGGFVTWSVGLTKPIGKSRTVGSHSGGLLTVDQARHIIAAQFCPYGKPGDRLIVRETWRYCDWTEDGLPWVEYKADGALRLCERGISEECASDRRWRTSIHMPRWASRLTLEITGVRVERLQDISEADARSEGINWYPFRPDDGFPICDGFTYKEDDGKCGLWARAAQAYRELLESINGPGSWNANPWVWVVEFKRA